MTDLHGARRLQRPESWLVALGLIQEASVARGTFSRGKLEERSRYDEEEVKKEVLHGLIMIEPTSKGYWETLAGSSNLGSWVYTTSKYWRKFERLEWVLTCLHLLLCKWVPVSADASIRITSTIRKEHLDCFPTTLPATVEYLGPKCPSTDASNPSLRTSNSSSKRVSDYTIEAAMACKTSYMDYLLLTARGLVV